MESYEKYVGAVFDGRYKIDRIIGVGGMAVVFRAYDMLMERTVAVKMLKDEIADDEEAVKRFINESKAISMMSHPNIVSIYDVSVRDDLKYIVMEHVEGITLKTYMNKKGILSPAEIISYSDQILRALGHAHEKGIIHRDIKPQNIMLLRSGLIKVTDFGIAKLAGAETVTMTDKAIGTVYYISPEQASGQEIDARSDLYSLGVMMYEMATGVLPFTADSPVSVAMMQINDEPKLPGELNSEIPRGLEQIIGIAMEKKPQDRYQNAETMRRQLQRLKENPDIIFKIPKRKPSEEEEGVSILSMLFGNGPIFPVIAGVALAFLIIFSIGAAYVFNRMMTATDQISETITVPSFTGIMYTNELEDWFSASDIYRAKVEYSYTADYQSDMIISQDPAADSKRKVVAGEQYCDMILTVSRPPEEVRVPDLSGMDAREARMKLKESGLKMVVEYTESDYVGSGQVIKTAPESNGFINSGETVTVYISSGVPEGEIEVPDFKGMTEKKAFEKLLELKLLPGTVKYVKDKAKAGTVLSQVQEKGTKVIRNTKIDMTVSGGANYNPNSANPFEEAPETTAPQTTAPQTTAPEPDTVPDTTADEAGEITEPEGDTGDSPEDTSEPQGGTVEAGKTGQAHTEPKNVDSVNAEETP